MAQSDEFFSQLSAASKRNMRCPEYLRLRQHYEAAHRHWGRVILSTDANVVGKLGRQAFEIKETAFADRNAAKKRLDDHSPDL